MIERRERETKTNKRTNEGKAWWRVIARETCAENCAKQEGLGARFTMYVLLSCRYIVVVVQWQFSRLLANTWPYMYIHTSASRSRYIYSVHKCIWYILVNNTEKSQEIRLFNHFFCFASRNNWKGQTLGTYIETYIYIHIHGTHIEYINIQRLGVHMYVQARKYRIWRHTWWRHQSHHDITVTS